jgi:hypothetical protein
MLNAAGPAVTAADPLRRSPRIQGLAGTSEELYTD